MTPTQEWIAAHINNLVESRFYGKVTLVFQNGNLESVQKQETLIVPKEINKHQYRVSK